MVTSITSTQEQSDDDGSADTDDSETIPNTPTATPVSQIECRIDITSQIEDIIDQVDTFIDQKSTLTQN